jgi:peptidoglycan/xylan/chitin deacetylase (PgdA/CDA1 family)
VFHVPVKGFVIQQRVESRGADRGANILRQWTKQGLDLGNHTWSHSDVNDLPASARSSSSVFP